MEALVPHFMSPHLAVRDGPAPWPAVRPGLVIADREDIDVSVEHQVSPRMRALEGADHVRELGVGVDDSEGERAGLEKGRDVRDRLAGVTRRIRTLRLHEPRVEVEQHVAIGVDAVEQRLLGVVHGCVPPLDGRETP